MTPQPPLIAVTPGEPAGIGPDLCARLALAAPAHARLVFVADPILLAERARQLGFALALPPFDPVRAHAVSVLPVALRAPAKPGRLDPRNAAYVLDTLGTAADACLARRFDALVTGPVHKGAINEAGIAFTGHTEFLAERAHSDVVMMLATQTLRVALATTHVPLAQVSRALTPVRLARALEVLHGALRDGFGVADPHVLVCGLNPHAGESGHLGREEIEVIEPVLARLRARGLRLTGPVPADTAFVPERLRGMDAVLAMYHDQGLPVLKAVGFGLAVNVTLGLPFIRTSVDHGTALALAGSGRADACSLNAALALAVELARARHAA